MTLHLAHRTVATFRGRSGDILKFTSGAGAYVHDQFGNRYLDLVSGYGPVILGHRDPEFLSDFSDLLREGLHFPGYSRLHAEYLTELAAGLPGRDYLAGFFRSSSEAVSAAQRIVALHTGQKGLIRCGFLGWHDSQMFASPRWHEPLSSSVRYRIRKEHSGWRGVSGDERPHDWIDLNLKTLADLLGRTAPRVGLMAIDAYQLELTPEVELVEIIDLCHLHGVRVLLDETKTAGRVGDGGLLGKPGVGTPDLVVFGKAIGNGAPLSLLLFDPELEATFVDARVGGTYGKELSGVAAGLTTLRIMRRRKGWDLLSRVGTNIAQAINDGLSSSPLAGLCWVTPRFDGAMFDLLFRQDVVGQSDLRAGLQQSFLHEGIILLQGHPSFPTLAHEGIDPSILEEAGRAVSQSLAGAAILNATSANA